MKKELVKLANHLDNIGHGDLADRLDDILKSAEDVEGTDLDANQMIAAQKAAEEEGPTQEEIAALKERYPRHAGESEMDYLARMERSWQADQNVLEVSEDIDRMTAEAPPVPPKGEAVGEDDFTGVTDGAFDSPAEAEALAFDQVFAANSAQERIDKLAELMSGEFTTYTPGTFSR